MILALAGKARDSTAVTEFLKRNAKLYPDEVALVELNPEVEDTRRMQGTANRSYTIGNMLYRLRPNPHCTPKIQRHPLFDPLRHIILRAG